MATVNSVIGEVPHTHPQGDSACNPCGWANCGIAFRRLQRPTAMQPQDACGRLLRAQRGLGQVLALAALHNRHVRWPGVSDCAGDADDLKAALKVRLKHRRLG